MINHSDTIAAIATALTTSGIGIVRISGDDAIRIVDKLFISHHENKKLTDVKTHTINYGQIVDPKTGNILDEVLVSVMKAPNTYTKENVVEINTHGGVVVMQKILRQVLKEGARLAEPGEFTKRAFLNGRIDLSQAEAVIDIINAQTELSLESSVNQLNGALSVEVEKINNEILSLIAHIEANIDYPEYDIEELENKNVLNTVNKIDWMINALISTYDNGKIIHEGIKTVIVGKPNVGKSSLLNRLIREQRAIVTDIPGTTRDVLEEYMNLNGIPLKLMDTAGIRETDDIVEQIGVTKTKESIELADLVIFLVDSSQEISDDDIEIFNMIGSKKSIILLNKIDLGQVVTKEQIAREFNHHSVISTSVKDNEGLHLLVDEIERLFSLGHIDINSNVYITNVRHKKALDDAILSVEKVKEGIMLDMPIDFLSIDIKNIYTHLSELTGDKIDDDIINKIFSQFCLGK